MELSKSFWLCKLWWLLNENLKPLISYVITIIIKKLKHFQNTISYQNHSSGSSKLHWRLVRKFLPFFIMQSYHATRIKRASRLNVSSNLGRAFSVLFQGCVSLFFRQICKSPVGHKCGQHWLSPKFFHFLTKAFLPALDFVEATQKQFHKSLNVIAVKYFSLWK